MPTIRRGEALWINIARAVNWLQPTDILPRLVFPGGAPDELQARVREDLEATLAFFRTQYGIQADPDFTIYIPTDVDALIQTQKHDGANADEASLRAQWNVLNTWAGYGIVVRQSDWPGDLSTGEIAWARYTITHEYFHILQRQLSDGRANAWLTEGTASWVDDEHKVFDGEQMWRNLRDGQLPVIMNDTPTLRSTESDNGGLEYRLGWLATDHLTANTDPDFPIEFWRQLSSTEAGPHRRWTSTLDWRTVFHRVSGQLVSEFYAEFDARQREQAVANAVDPRSYEYDGGLIPPGSYTDEDGNLVIGSYEYGDAWIRGRVASDDGAPVAGVFVNAFRVEGEVGVSLNQRAETDADGSFAVRAPEAGDYILSVDIDDDCTRYYSDGRLIDNEKQWNAWQQARPISVSQSDVSDIDIQVPPGVCGWQIRGRVVGPVGEPLAGVTVMACPVGSGTCTSVDATTYDGSFAVSALVGGE